MVRSFNTPTYYRSPVVTTIKSVRRQRDPRKKDFSPHIVETPGLRFKIARHFGFCFGVENAIEIAYRAVAESVGRRVFLLSEMIHNPRVNQDLSEKGVRFLMDTAGRELIKLDELNEDDIVILPAFGVTLSIYEKLCARGINPKLYDATCPFVEKVWKRARELGESGYSIVIHGKHYHEETRATFSRASVAAESVVVRDMEEAKLLAPFILGEEGEDKFYTQFEGRHSPGFKPHHLHRIGVVNQTTMLAGETEAIGDYLKGILFQKFGSDTVPHHFADTRDTLCYATSENQTSVNALVQAGGDLALVVGGYNSSNTFHLAKLCSRGTVTFHIKDSSELISKEEIRHLDLQSRELITSIGWLPVRQGPIDILITAGASTPDSQVDEVIMRVASFFNEEEAVKSAAVQLSA